jgi:hypothetical protein
MLTTVQRARKDEAARRKLLRFPLLSRAVERRAATLARSLKKIAGETIQVDGPYCGPFESHPGCTDNKIRRKTDAEAHRMGVWFWVYFELDCRKVDFLSQAAGRLRGHIAELTEIADRIDAAAKRRRKTSRPSRKAERVSA